MGGQDLLILNSAYCEWETFYNMDRPHHSLDLMSPAEYLHRHYSGLAPPDRPSHMY